MMKKQLVALALAGMTVMSVAQAEEFLDNRWYVAPFGTYVMPDGRRGVEDGWGGGLGVGKILNEHFNVELKGFYQTYGGYNNIITGVDGGNWEMAGGAAEVQYYLSRDKFAPYTVLGAGAMNNWVPGDTGVSFIAEAGVGIAYELLDNLLLRTDVRYRYTNDFGADLHSSVNDYHDMVVNAGVVIPFGEKPKPVIKEEPKPVTPDCSASDDDNDGVNNCLDKCPGSLADSQVDASGCPISVELKGVQFKVNSAVLTNKAKTILDGVAKDLIASSQGKDIEVQGHTSSEASNAYNMKLSIRRSQAVVDYLKAQGVKDKLYAKGYGETQLKVSPDNTEALRAINRRVELHWME